MSIPAIFQPSGSDFLKIKKEINEIITMEMVARNIEKRVLPASRDHFRMSMEKRSRGSDNGMAIVMTRSMVLKLFAGSIPMFPIRIPAA